MRCSEKNGPVIQSMESVLRPTQRLRWERFVKDEVLSRESKSEGVMDGESSESTQQDTVGAGKGKTETERLRWCWRREVVYHELATCCISGNLHFFLSALSPPRPSLSSHLFLSLSFLFLNPSLLYHSHPMKLFLASSSCRIRKSGLAHGQMDG